MLDTYEHGYHKALIDICDWFDMHSTNLTFHKAYTKKRMPVILKAFTNNPEKLMKYGSYCELWVDKDWKDAKLLEYKEKNKNE